MNFTRIERLIWVVLLCAGFTAYAGAKSQAKPPSEAPINTHPYITFTREDGAERQILEVACSSPHNSLRCDVDQDGMFLIMGGGASTADLEKLEARVKVLEAKDDHRHSCAEGASTLSIEVRRT